jgi:L-fuculose-phosphate aldolase
LSDETSLKNLEYAARILFLNGHSDTYNGQISYRHDEDLFWIRRTLIGLEETTEKDFLLIDHQGNIVKGAGRIPGEWDMHKEIYSQRKDIQCIIHTHPFHSIIFGATELELKPISHEVIPVLSTKRLDPPFNGKSLSDTLSSTHTLFLKNHGIIAVGKSIPEAVCYAISLEQACKMQLFIESTNLPFSWSNEREAKIKEKLLYNETTINHMWNYWCRRIKTINGKGE